MGVTVETELTLHVGGQAVEHGQVVGSDIAGHEGNLLFCASKLTRFARSGIGQHFVEFGNQFLDSGDELNQTFGDKHRTEVITIGSALSHDIGDVVHHLIQAHSLLFDFLGDEANVGLGLEGALEGDMAGGTTHKFNEVPVLASGVTVALDVTNQFAVSLAGSVETKGSLNLLVLQVTIDGLGATDYLYAIILGGIVFSKHTSVGVGVVATDNHESLDAKFAKDFDSALKLLYLLELRTATSDDIKTTSIAIFVNKFVSELYILMVNETAGSHQEAIQFAILVERLHAIVETADYVVTTRSLTTREDDTYVDGFGLLGFASDKLHNGHTVGVGEEGFDFLLISYTLSCCTFLSDYSTLEGLGKFGLIGSASNLQCTFFHWSKIFKG